MTKRRVVLALTLVVLVATSGCIGFLTGSKALKFESKPVAVSQSAQEATGFERTRKTTTVINRTFKVADQKRKVKVTNHLAEYARSTDSPVFGEQKVSRFTVFSTPQVKIAGQGPFNPVDNLNNRQLALRLQQQYETIKNVKRVSNRTVTVLGTDTVVGKFKADAKTVAGTQTEVYMAITKVEHEGDYVIAVAVYPTKVDEQQNVNRLLKGIQHGENA